MTQKKRARKTTAAATVHATAATNSTSNDIAIHNIVKQIAADAGLGTKQQQWIAELFDPDSNFDLTNESIKIEREKWKLNVKMQTTMRSDDFQALDDKEKIEVLLEFRKEKLELMQQRTDHTNKLDGGNIAKGDKMVFRSNQGDLAVPGKTRGIAHHRYTPETHASYEEEDRYIEVHGIDVLASHSNHTMDRDNQCLDHSVRTSIKVGIYYSGKEAGEDVEWDGINTEEYQPLIALTDQDTIVLTKGRKDVVDASGKIIPDEKQLTNQRIAYAEAIGVSEDILLSDGSTTLKKQDISEFNGLADLVFNMLIIHAASNEAAIVIAVGTHAKNSFLKKGAKAFVTLYNNFMGWKYHPESEHRIRVLILERLIRSDEVESNFLSAVCRMKMIYNYAAKRLLKEYPTPELRKALNQLAGATGMGYKFIRGEIEEQRESNTDAEMLTDLEIFKRIESDLLANPKVPNGSISGYKKILHLLEQVDVIKAKVDSLFEKCKDGLTKLAIFNSIEKDLPVSISTEAKNMYRGRLALEKHRNEVKKVHKEAARIQQMYPDANPSEILEEVKKRNPDIPDAALTAAKHGLGVKFIHEEAARIQKMNPTANPSEILEEVKKSNPDIPDAALTAAKHGLDTKFIHEEAARIQKMNPDADLSEILEEVKKRNPDIPDGALTAAKHGLDTKFIHEEAARIQKMNPDANPSEILEEVKKRNPDIPDAALTAAKHGLNVKFIHEEAARIQEMNPDADLSEILEEVKKSNPDIPDGALTSAKHGLNVKFIHEEAARIQKMNPDADLSEILEEVKKRNPDIPDGALTAAKNGLGVKCIHEEAARIQEMNPDTDLSEILEEVKKSNPDIPDGAFKFAKHGLDVKFIHSVAAPVLVLPPTLTTSTGRLRWNGSEYQITGIKKGDIHNHDVLCGTGTFRHLGNVAFRQFVDRGTEDYQNCQYLKKPAYVMRIVQAVRSQSPPGRFLLYDKQTDTWNDIGDAKAIEKAYMAMWNALKRKSPSTLTNSNLRPKKARVHQATTMISDDMTRAVSYVESCPDQACAPQSYETMFTGALEKHKLDTVKILKESAAKGEKIVSTAAMLEARNENVPIIRRVNTFMLKFGGKHRTEPEITAALIKAEKDAVQLYIAEARKKKS